MKEEFIKAIQELDAEFARELITAIEKGFVVNIVKGEEVENFLDKCEIFFKI